MNSGQIGVLGAYGRGRHAWLAHRPDKGWKITMGADVNPENLAKFQEQFPEAGAVTDYREVLANPAIELVFVTTPDFLHEEMTVAALEAGKTVYLEKPLALTIEGCDRILETAWRTGSKLFVGHNMRYLSMITEMKEIADSGLIGDIQCGWCRHFIDYGGDAYFRDWHSERKYVNGLLLQKGAHDIDVMHWIMGTYTARVVGMGMLSVYDKTRRRSPGEPGDPVSRKEHWPPLEQDGFSPVIDVEDHNMIMMQMENGAQGCYMQCHYTPDSERNYTFIGTRGRVENVIDRNNELEVHVWTRRGFYKRPDQIRYLRSNGGGHDGSDELIIDNFLDFARNGAATNANPVAARYAVATGVQGHASMRGAGCPMDIPPLRPELIEYFDNGQQK